MRSGEIEWKRHGLGRRATIHGSGGRVFDLYQDRLAVPIIQVSEFHHYNAEGEAVTMTHYLTGEGSLARFLKQNCCSAEQMTRAA